MEILRTSSKDAQLARTRIYLTALHQVALAELAKQQASSKSELIRQALDLYLLTKSQESTDVEKKKREKKLKALGMMGMWADREDLADPVAWVRKLRDTPRYPELARR